MPNNVTAHTENQKRLELALANTADIYERYDNADYHRLTWRHELTCSDCCEITIYHCDSIIGKHKGCPECGNQANNTVRGYIEIVEFDEAYAWN